MEWLDILTGEVRARRDSRQHAEAQREALDDELRSQRVTAALRFVARPALTQMIPRLEQNGLEASLGTQDNDAVRLECTGQDGQQLIVGARPGTGNEIVLHWQGASDKTGGERTVMADALTAAMLRELVRGVLLPASRQGNSG